MGNLLLKKDDPEGAERYYNKVLDLYPHNPIALNNVAGVKLRYHEVHPVEGFRRDDIFGIDMKVSVEAAQRFAHGIQ